MKHFLYKNTTVHFTDYGKGNTVFLLHGFLENKEMWDVLGRILATKYRVISVDLLGHGKSDCLGYVHTMEDQADMLFALASHLKVRKISLAGHSMGGYIALAFAELYPDYVRHLILINSTARADSDERKTNRDRAIEAVKKNSTTFIRIAITNLFPADSHQLLQHEIQHLISAALQTPLQGIIAALEGMKIRQDREVLLHFGPYPKLIIAGNKDTIIPIQELYEQTGQTDTLLEVLDCGHMAIIEAQDDISRLLQAFLKQR